MPGIPTLLTSTKRPFDQQRYEEKLRRFNASLNYKTDIDHILGELEKLPYASLLDIGCGTGHFVNLLRRRHPDRKIDGFDRFNYGGTNCATVDICATRFNWEDQYDVVTVIHAINHFAELDVALSRLSLLTKPQGHVVILTPNPAFVRMIRVLNEYAYLTTRGGDETIVAYLGADELIARMTSRRFRHLHTQAFGTSINFSLQEAIVNVPERLVVIFKNEGK